MRIWCWMDLSSNRRFKHLSSSASLFQRSNQGFTSSLPPPILFFMIGWSKRVGRFLPCYIFCANTCQQVTSRLHTSERWLLATWRKKKLMLFIWVSEVSTESQKCFWIHSPRDFCLFECIYELMGGQIFFIDQYIYGKLIQRIWLLQQVFQNNFWLIFC